MQLRLINGSPGRTCEVAVAELMRESEYQCHHR
jgi:hypothetical protein